MSSASDNPFGTEPYASPDVERVNEFAVTSECVDNLLALSAEEQQRVINYLCIRFPREPRETPLQIMMEKLIPELWKTLMPAAKQAQEVAGIPLSTPGVSGVDNVEARMRQLSYVAEDGRVLLPFDEDWNLCDFMRCQDSLDGTWVPKDIGQADHG